MKSQNKKTTSMKPRSLGNVNNEEWKGLDYARRRNAPRTDEKNDKTRSYDNQDTVLALQAFGFDTLKYFANND